MSKSRDMWWGYAKAMIRAYPERTTEEEASAVKAAIEKTEKLDGGEERMKFIHFIYFQKHVKKDRRDLEYAALHSNISYETAKRWHREFVNTVASEFRCDGLPKH